MRVTLALFWLLFFSNLLVAQPKPEGGQPSIVFTHVTIIDVTGAPSKPDMTVIISGARIAELGQSKDIRVPKGAQVVDGAGKYLIPGLWDMHWHSLPDEDMRKFYFPLAIANGVTGVRDLFGDCLKGCKGFPDIQDRNQWRKETAEGKLLAPRIVASSQIVDGAKPTWPEFLPIATAAQARQIVQTFKQRGVDFTKVYSLLSREAYFALADEAKKQRLPFAGHIPIYIRPLEASNAGQKSLEHLDFILAFSTRETEIMREMAEEMEKIKTQPPDFFKALVYYVLDHNLIKMTESYDGQKVTEITQQFVKNDTWICPTLVLHRAFAFPEGSGYANDVRLKYVPQETKEEWAAMKLWRLAEAENQVGLKKGFPRQLQILGAARRAGMNFLAGTDVTNLYLYPGFSLHDELVLFVQAGFTPLEALQTATLNPAKYLGLTNSLGTIEKGKIADLVLLEANPLEDIHNTQRIAAVVLNGHLQNREKLNMLLAEVEAAAKKK